MADSLGTTEDDLVPALSRSVTGAISPVVVDRAPCQERSTAVDLTSLPVPRFFERETAPYITAGAIVAQHPVTNAANFSFARLKVLGPRRAMLGVSPNHHLGRLAALAAELGEGLPIAVTVGNHPAVMLAACLYLGFGDDELRCAGALLREPLRVTQCETSSLLVPAEAEVVLEGVVDPSHRTEEGPVSEYHGHYHEYGAGYEVEFQRLTTRSDAMFQVVLPGLFREHILLGGVAIAAVLERNLRELAPNLVSVAVPETGAGRTAAVISLDRPRPGQARQLMMAAFALVPLIKQVTVVDPDVDPWDATHVEWARMVRSRPERDLFVVSGARTDRSEPLSVDGVVGKLGIDATARESDRPTGPLLARLPVPALEAAVRVLADEGGLGQFPPTLGRSVGGAY
jgi:4-hydroxy-3-polyprenylbenzoate decarboxylase